jgi:uncharacterized repeat protein (TIGR01451 family)/fimbrial isopeptide formation D2 family protein
VKLLLVIIALAGLGRQASAQTPPLWNGGTPTRCGGNLPDCDGSAAIKPAAWPATAQWVAYSWGTTYPDALLSDKHPVRDQRVQDPSNGGTTPQNYVNVSSGCSDQSLPSIYYYFDPAGDNNNGIIFFRWRVEQIANNYATGPSAGSYSSSNPWNSALWTVFLDTNGDGYRDFAMHLDGSSGSPAKLIDVLRSIWSQLKSNSIDYVGDPANIHSLFTNPTAFATANGGSLYQFSGAAPAAIQWPNGSSETTWDYGTTRSINISTGSCSEYFVDYQIPLRMLSAAAFSGPAMTIYSPFQFLFATANSLNNPFQKDIVWEGNFVCDASSPGPFGDAVTLAGGIIPQPIATAISAGSINSCVIPVTAQIMDALTVTNCSSTSELVSAQFKYYYDINGDGQDNDGGTWVNIGDPSIPIGTTVDANWNLAGLIQGQYLLALEITDNRGHTTQTWMGRTITAASGTGSITSPFCDHAAGCPTQALYTNVPPIDVYTPQTYVGLVSSGAKKTLGVNYQIVNIGGSCGVPPPTVTKTHNISDVQQGGPVVYTLTLNNASATTVTVSQITDNLPSGFTYTNGTSTGGTIGAPASSTGTSGTITWTFSPAVTVAGGASVTFSYTVNAGTGGGTFFNSGTFQTSVGALTGTDTTGVTVHTAALTPFKSVALASAPSTPVSTVNLLDTVQFKITVVNNSQTTVNNVVVSDPMPPGFTYALASASTPAATPVPTTNPGVGSNGTVTWNVASMAANGGSFTATVNAIATQGGPAVNTVTITSTEAATVTASANVFVSGPLMTISKNANVSVVTPVGTVDYTIEYANIGNGATGAVLTSLTDVVPAGFTLVTGGGSPTTANCTQAGGVGTIVTCTAAALTTPLAAGTTASVTLRFSVSGAAPILSTNTATINSSNTNSPSASFTETVQLTTTCTTSNYFFKAATGNVSAGSSYGVGYVTMTNVGTGYTSPPAVNFTGGGGSGAAGTATGNATNTVSGVNVTNPGNNYTTAPVVGFTGGGGINAAATAVLTSNQFLAQTTAGTSDTTITKTVRDLTEFARFYQDPVDNTTAYLLSSASVTTVWDNPNPASSKISYTITLNDFDTVNNTQSTIATVTPADKNNGGTFTDTFTVPATTILKAGHRLLWIISARDPNNNANTTDTLHYNSPTAGAQSFGTVCLLPVRMSLTKRANKLSVNTSGSDTIQYTIQYTNTSTITIPGVVITDPLPAGITFVSSVPANGVSGVLDPTVGTNGTVTWTVGSVVAGATATLVINGTVLSTISGASTTNTATLTDTYTPTLTASATTVIASPNVVISKRSNGTNFVPGDTFSYTLSVVNAGSGAATGVTVTDTLPAFLTPVSNAFSTTGGSVAVINITNGGSGYASAPLVTISGGGGSNATATAVISGGSVVRVYITNVGSGYTSAPTVTFAAGAGTTATATSQLAGTLTSASAAGQTLTFNVGGLAIGASTSLNITVQVASTGVPAGQNPVTNTASVVDTYGTTPRTASAVVTITATPALTLSETATTPSKVVFVNVTAGGTYTSVPTVSFSGGGCATEPTAIVSTNPSAGVSSGAYGVTGVTLTSFGSGCTSAPTALFTGAGAGGALATPIIGFAPGDTITYNVLLSSTGTADSAGDVITASIPANTSWTSGGTFSGGQVTSNVGTLAAGTNTTLIYTVTVNAALPAGTTTLSQTASATSTNTTPPAAVNKVLTAGAEPRYTITDAPDGDTVAFPLTTLLSNATNTSTISVGSSSLILVGDYIALSNGGSYVIAQVTGKSGSVVTLNQNVTATGGTNILPVEEYTLAYSNIGNATGTSVTVTDVLPGGLLYAGTPLSAVASATVTAGGTGYISAPTVTFSGGGGSGATATAIINGSGNVTGIFITNPGSGYSSNPTITFGGPGTGAIAAVSLADLVPVTAPAIGATGQITWNIGTLPNGSSGTVKFLAFPTAAGTYTNTGIVSDGTAPNARNAYDTAATTFGALNPSKVTTTPNVTSGTGVAHYVISVQNPLTTTTASDVAVTDNLPSGFTYKSGTTVINGVAASNPCTANCVGAVGVVSGGSGYTSAPTVSINGGGGSGATAVATISGGSVTAVIVTNGGSSFTSTPTVLLAGGGGSGATATASIATVGTPVWAGRSISPSSTLTIAFDADVSANVPNGTYDNEVLVASSNTQSLVFDYLGTTAEDVHVCAPAPTITAPAACANSAGNVASVAVRPAATYTWSINNGAIITNSSTGTVNSITIGSGGSGYTTPTITIAGGGGNGATATATVALGVITAITINNPGSGYTSAPTVTINAVGGGSGATAIAVVGTGIVFTVGSANATVSVVIAEGSCSVTASTTVSVVGPVITAQPADKTYCNTPSDLVLTITASGVTTFVWQRSTDGGTVWNAAPNAGLSGTDGTGTGGATASYTYRAGAASTGYKFRVLLTGTNGCSVTSNVATITNACFPDLAMTTDSDSPDPVIAGQNITYTQNFTNVALTNNTSQAIVMWQPIPTNTTFVSMTAPAGGGWACSNTSNGVISVAVTAGGSGYAAAPTVTFTGGGGAGAAAFATISGGVVTAVTVTNPGSGYLSNPTVVFSSGAAAATASRGNAETCTTSNVITAGSSSGNFTFVVKVDGSVADGSSITDNVRVTTGNDTNTSNNFNSAVTTVNRTIDIQMGETDNASVSPYGAHFIYPGNNPTAPQPLTWLTTVANGGPSRASNVVITDTMPFGFTYSSSSITTAGASCSYASASSILTCTVPTLDSTPTVTFTGGGPGSGATGVVTVNAAGIVTGIVITNVGSGYTSPPTVTITTAGTGSSATGTAVLGSGASYVDSVTITNGGSSYVTTPVISILGTTTIDTTQITNPQTVTYTETDTNHANDPASDTVTVVAPTVVKMLTMDATQWKNTATITWRTSYEQDNLGFYVWRQLADGTRQRVTDRIIAGSALISGRKIKDGRSYHINDNNSPAGVQYYIEDVDLRAVHTMHGPITPRPGTPGSSGSGASTDTDPSIGSVGGIFTNAPGMGVIPAAPAGPDGQRLNQQWTIAGSSAAKLVVTQEGWYRVRKSDLIAAGFDPGNASSRVSLFTDGVEVPISIPGPTFGTNDAIEFYGYGLDTPSAGGRIYYVTTATGRGLRIDASNVSGGGAAAPANYPYTFTRTERMLWFSALVDDGSRDNFYGQLVWTWPSAETLQVANIDPSGGDAMLEIALQGVTDKYDHVVSAVFNGHELGPIRYRNQVRDVRRFSVPQSWLVAGDNNLMLTATGGDDDVSVVDYVRIFYPHKYAAESNALAFTMPGATAGSVTGFTTNAVAIKVIDLTNAQAPVQLAVNVSSAPDGTKSVSFTTIGGGTRTLLALADNRVLAPAQIVLNQPSKLNATSNKADLVIITHRDFAAAANTLKAAREAQGITTMVVDVQNVYDEFSYGAHGPAAIKAMLKQASTTWVKPPKYVILFGDASWDPRNYMGFANIDFVPTKLVPTLYLKTASDDWFVDFKDDDSPSMAIGRLPVQTAEQAASVANKLARRTAPPTDTWAKTVEIITDRPSEVPFSRGGDALAAVVPAPFTTDRIDIGTSSDATSAILNAFNRGSLLTNYLGHGSVEIWSNYVFDSTMAAALTNGDKLPFVVTMNCLNGYFHDMFTESLAEALLKSPNGGAIGVMASSALTSPDQQLLVNVELYRQIFGGTSPAIGDAILKAKQATKDLDVRRSYILFGDPTMKLR